MKLIQDETAKQKVLAAFQRCRFSENKSERDRLIQTKDGEGILGTGYRIAFMGREPIRFYDFNGVLCHEEYGSLDGDTLPWMQPTENVDA